MSLSNLRNQLKRSTARLARQVRKQFEVQALERLTKSHQPDQAKATIIFAGLSENKFRLGGKVTALEFLPAFCSSLRDNGYRTIYTTSLGGLRKAIQNADYSVVVMIYREVGFIPNQPGLGDLLGQADLVLHHPDIGRIIGDKTSANAFLSQRGVPMPRLQTGETANSPVFSNHNNSSGAEVFLVDQDAALDADRYNADFVDTRVTIDGEAYYTTVRLMCIGEVITHAFVRARPVSEGNPSVHTKDTPVKLDLLRSLFSQLVDTNMDSLENLAKVIAAAVGPGFYAHDVLIDSSTDEVYLAETGFKFDNAQYCKRMSDIVEDLPSMSGFSAPELVAQASVPVFIELLDNEISASKISGTA